MRNESYWTTQKRNWKEDRSIKFTAAVTYTAQLRAWEINPGGSGLLEQEWKYDWTGTTEAPWDGWFPRMEYDNPRTQLVQKQQAEDEGGRACSQSLHTCSEIQRNELGSGVENIWVKISRKTNGVEFYFRLPTQGEVDESFQKQIRDPSKRHEEVGDFNYADICWETNCQAQPFQKVLHFSYWQLSPSGWKEEAEHCRMRGWQRQPRWHRSLSLLR